MISSSAGGTAGGAAGAGGGVLSKRGSATVDVRTNLLIVQDTPSKLDEIRRLIQKIDVSVKQVVIEARVVIADDKFSRQLGTRFGVGAGIYNNGRNITMGGRPADPEQSNYVTTAAGLGLPTPFYYTRIKPDQDGVRTYEYVNSVPYNVNLPVANAAGSLALTFLNIGNGNLVNLELSAAEAANRGKVISSPRVVTTDNQKASIEQGQEIKLRVGGGIGGAGSVVTVNAKLGLEVTPQVTPDGKIVLDVAVTKDSIAGFTSDNNPIVNTRRLTTKVIVNNGDTAVLGGIYEETITDTVDKVPFLGDAPIVGNLFKRTNRGSDKQELLIFLTPRIATEASGFVR